MNGIRTNGSRVTPLAVASGAIASFDAQVAAPLKTLKADIDPVQAGSGDPYLPGGGSNKWDEEWESGDLNVTTDGDDHSNASRIRSKNYIPVTPGATYYLTSSYPNTVVTFYDSSKAYPYNTQNVGWILLSSNKLVNIPDWCHYIRFYYNSTEYDNDVALNYPSTVTTYSPYSNIRPISGWDSVKVSATGKNLFDGKFYAGGSYNANVGEDYSGITEEAVTTISDGNYSISVSSWGGMGFITPPFNGKVTQTVHISGSTTAPSPRMSLYTLDKDKVVLSKTTYGTNRTTFDYNITLAEGEVYVFLWVATADTGTVTVSNIQCEFGNETTPYELPNGQTATIPLPHTVYGGELDIVSGSGSEEWGYIKVTSFNSLATNSSGHKRASVQISGCKNSPAAICNCMRYSANYNYGAVNTFYNSANMLYFVFDENEITTLAEANAWLEQNELVVVYPLSTPAGFITDPISTNSRAGSNNIFADSGNTTACYLKGVTT